MKHVTAIGCSSQYIDPMIRRHFNNDDNERTNRLALLAQCLKDDETTWWMSEEDRSYGRELWREEDILRLNARQDFVDFSCLPPPFSGHPTPNDTSSSTIIIIHSTPWLVRLQSVSIKIPPLPSGPRELLGFFLQRSSLLDFVIQRSKKPQLHPSFMSSSNCNNNSDNHNNNPYDPDTHDEGNDVIDTTRTIEWETISPIWTLDGNTAGYQTFIFPSGGMDVTLVRLLCLSNQISEDGFEFNRHETFHMSLPRAIAFNSIRFD
jgi:hypothetical protein